MVCWLCCLLEWSSRLFCGVERVCVTPVLMLRGWKQAMAILHGVFLQGLALRSFPASHSKQLPPGHDSANSI